MCSRLSPTTDTAGTTRPPLLRLLIIATLLTLAVALWYLFRYSLQDEEEVRWTPPSRACDLQAGPCTTTLAEGVSLTLDVAGDAPVRALEVLPLRVRLDGLTADAVVVTFEGRDMDMGLHRFPLQAAGDGLFRGEGQVAICTEAVMPWRAKVVVDTPRGRLGSWFDFTVVRRPS